MNEEENIINKISIMIYLFIFFHKFYLSKIILSETQLNSKREYEYFS